MDDDVTSDDAVGRVVAGVLDFVFFDLNDDFSPFLVRLEILACSSSESESSNRPLGIMDLVREDVDFD